MDPYFQNHVLHITVVECVKLKDTEWFTKQDPYVCLQYGSTNFRTRTCSSGGTAPVFQANFTLTLIQGLREIDIGVWNRHRLSSDNLIGSGNVHLQDVLSRGYDDRCWTIVTKSRKYAGEVRLIMQYSQPTPIAAISTPAINTTAIPPPQYGAPSTAYPPHPPSAPPPPPPHHHHPHGNPGQYNRMYPSPPY